MAELADALDSGSSEGSLIQVQVLLSAPKRVLLQYLSKSARFLFYRPVDWFLVPESKKTAPVESLDTQFASRLF